MKNSITNNDRAIRREELLAAVPAVFADYPARNVSNKYDFLRTADILNKLVEHDWYPTHAHQSRARTTAGYHIAPHCVRLRQPRSKQVRIGDGFLELVLLNSHNRSTAFRFYMGVYRMVCSNGLVVGSHMQGGRTKHIGNAHERVDGIIDDILGRVPVVSRAVEQWQYTHLTLHQRVLLAQDAYFLRYGEKREGPQPTQLLKTRRDEDQSDDLWTVFNTIQENLVMGGQPYIDANNHRRTTRAVTEVNRLTHLNRALWDKAEEYNALSEAA